MNLEQLRDSGGLVSEQPVKTEITWRRETEEGEQETITCDIHVVRLGYGDYERLFIPLQQHLAKKGDGQQDEDGPQHFDEDSRRSLNAELIALSVRLGDEVNERLTYDMAYRLVPSLATAMLGAIHRVNRSSKKKIKPHGRDLARAGDERDRGADDRGGEGTDVAGGVPVVDSLHQPAGDAEHPEEAGVGLCTAGDAGE